MSGPTVSVLMSVHDGVDPEHLAEALASVSAQVRRADQVVVVLDGPVSEAHEEVLRRSDGLTIIRSPENRGAGHASTLGLAVCWGDYVARADSDDVNEPHRLERQLAVLAETGADVCSAAMTEFESATGREVGIRRTALTHAQFARRMPGRNPVNHPASVLRRAAANAAGGYQDLLLLEDYDLWARMLVHGAVFVGVDEPLVRFRRDGMQSRRTGPVARTSEAQLQRRLVSYGLVSPRRARWNLLARGVYRSLPRPLLERAYALLFLRVGRRR
jgi:glycosyltransferase involved in cell wall biosynthesis